jgi:Flp pilus assembly protein CpaB
MLALTGAAAICAGLAISLVNGYAAEVRAQVGPLVPVVVAREGLAPGRVITSADVGSRLAVVRVPARFAPAAGLRSPEQALGLRTAAPLAAGDYVGRSQLERPTPSGGRSSDAARSVEIPVWGAASLRELLPQGARADVLVTASAESARPRTYLAVQSVEVASLREPGDASGSGEGTQAPDGVAMLRVTLRQAVLLTAAANFAREIRLVPRPAGDRRRLGPTVVGAGDLGP